MNELDRPLAKSLHTVTVLVRVARGLMAREGLPPATAFEAALTVLELSEQPDPYGLRDTARRQLAKGAR